MESSKINGLVLIFFCLARARAGEPKNKRHAIAATEAEEPRWKNDLASCPPTVIAG
jgi:hypothetical protein